MYSMSSLSVFFGIESSIMFCIDILTDNRLPFKACLIFVDIILFTIYEVRFTIL